MDSGRRCSTGTVCGSRRDYSQGQCEDRNTRDVAATSSCLVEMMARLLHSRSGPLTTALRDGPHAVAGLGYLLHACTTDGTAISRHSSLLRNHTPQQHLHASLALLKYAQT